MNEPWEIQLLGALRLCRGDRAEVRFPTQRAAGMLARLAYRPGENVSREELVDMLWPDCLLDKGLPRLSGELNRLRTLLEPLGEVARGSVIRADYTAISLNSAAVTTDIAAFESAHKSGMDAASTGARLPFLAKAVETYGGTLLPRYDYPWIEPARQGLTERFLQAMEQLVAQLAQTGEHDRAVAYARRAVEMNARNEDAYCPLLRALLRAGRFAETQQLYREMERMLEEHSGNTPSAPARRLFEEATRRVGEASASRPVAAPQRETATDPAQETVLATAPPSGTVTFLATDLEGSTTLLRRLGGALYETVRERHHALLRQEFRLHGGHEFRETGDGFRVAFASPGTALECAVACQRALNAESWSGAIGPIAVRMAVHVAADVEAKGGEYRGLGVQESARQVEAAHGGQILVSEAATLLLRGEGPPGVTFKNLGRFRLRDAPDPEPLYQAVYPGMPDTTFPEPNAPYACAPNIPASLTRFVGREADQDRLAALVQDPETRLVTLTGMGGTGKTRLVLEVARRLTGAFSGAVYFVPLADLTDARYIAGNILSSLRVPPPPDEDAMDTATRRLSEQPSLLVLDNFEQLVEEGAMLVRELLERVASLTCLITSRQLLGISPEREFEVPPLPTPKPGAREAEQLGGNVSVQLFVDRAQRRRPDFRLTRSNAAAVAELCERLEGMPLSIELAAAWVKMLSPAQLLTELKNILRSSERDLPERHRSLKAVIDGSYRLLTPEQQNTFAQLSVFRNGWTVEAASAVCEDSFALYSLSQLRDASLILAEESEDDGTRYRMLETLREYAGERLAERQEEEAARRRHHDFFVRLASTADTELKGEHQAAWCRRLDDELRNLQAAMAFSDDQGRLQVASDLQRYWIIHNRLSEGREWLENVLSGNTDGIPAVLLSRAINVAGVLAWSAGDFAAARSHLDSGLQRCREADNKCGTALALNNRANLASQQGEFMSARADYEESLTLWREMGEIAPEAITLSNLGGVAAEQQDYTAARRFLQESLRVQEQLKDHFLRANTLLTLGDLEKELGNYSVAIPHLVESFSIKLQMGDQKATAVVTIVLARVIKKMKCFPQSATLYAAADSLLRNAQETLLPAHRDNFDADVSELRVALPRGVFEGAWSAGYAMTVKKLSDYIDVVTLDV